MRLATIAAGYADGLPRSLSDRGAAYFGNQRLPIVGRASMDSIVLTGASSRLHSGGFVRSLFSNSLSPTYRI
jgi:alanine racemase